MNIAVVSSRCPFGNGEPYLRTELAELRRHFSRITLVPLRTPSGEARGVPEGIDVLAWPLLSREILARAARTFVRRPAAVARALWELALSRDRGHAKNALVFLKGIALADWALEHDVGHVHAYWLSAPATLAMICGDVAGIPWSATAHRWDIYEHNALDVKARTARFVRTISARGTSDLRKCSPRLDDRIVQVPLGTVVPSGLPPPARASAAFHIVCPAALVPVKGHDDLIAAVATLREQGIPVRCTIAGEGPLRAQLERNVKERGLESVIRFAGFVPQRELHGWYCDGKVNAVVLSSREDRSSMEGIPSALVEAMAHGIPVIATASGSIGELVDAQCGRIVVPGDAAALASAIADVYQHPFQAQMRAAAAYARVAAAHDVRRQMAALSERIRS